MERNRLLYSALVLAVAVVIASCNGASTSDGGTDDMAVSTDAGLDSARPDAGPHDAGTPDLGTDAGSTDATVADVPTTDAGGLDTLCTSSGGTVMTTLCCLSTDGFPNSCGIGACGCSPDYSHEVPTCSCPDPQCFDPEMGCH